MRNGIVQHLICSTSLAAALVLSTPARAKETGPADTGSPRLSAKATEVASMSLADANSDQDIVVTGIRQSPSSAQNIKRNAHAIFDALVAEDIDAGVRLGDWARISRHWRNNDVVTLRLPMRTRLVPIDAQHPDRVAIMYGPLMMAQDVRYSYSVAGAHDTVLDSLPRREPAEGQPGPRLVWSPALPYTADSGPISDLTPAAFREWLPYRSYFDLSHSRLL